MSATYKGLRFSFADIEREIEGMSALARQFLNREAPNQIAEWKQQLITFRTSDRTQSFEWQIPESKPLHTKPSNGAYEAGSRRGRETIIGSLSGIWAIHRLPRDDRDSRSHFLLNGKASVTVRLMRAEDTHGTAIADWNVDVGDVAAPGCHFHLQTLQLLPVPRHPALLVTPMDALEFLLAEMFQDQWQKHVATSKATTLWAEYQRVRLSRLLRWYVEFVDKCSGSPWTSLKAEKPPSNLFT